jgi:opacity protein-like surface antigen
MKRIVLLLALFALGLSAASFAVAKPPPGKGKNKGSSTSASTTVADPESCHPKISVVLKGDFVSGGGESFGMDVKQANYHGHELVGSALTLKVDDKTSFKRNGPAELADFKAGDRLNVQARACKAKKGAAKDPNATPPAFLAKRVTGHPAKTSGSDSDAGESGTTTTTP